MSRVGKKPIPLPKGVKLQIGEQLQVEGPKGKLSVPIPKGISVRQADGRLEILRDGDQYAALHGLTRALARELAQTNVTVNAVCPGYTDTEIVSEAIGNIVAKTGRTQEEALRELTAHNPQGRLIRPDEVAEAVGWLCLPSSGSINGQSVVVAGGELM